MLAIRFFIDKLFIPKPYLILTERAKLKFKVTIPSNVQIQGDEVPRQVGR